MEIDANRSNPECIDFLLHCLIYNRSRLILRKQTMLILQCCPHHILAQVFLFSFYKNDPKAVRQRENKFYLTAFTIPPACKVLTNIIQNIRVIIKNRHGFNPYRTSDKANKDEHCYYLHIIRRKDSNYEKHT